MKTIGEWFPDRERSVAVGWFNAGTSLGAVIAPVLAALVAAIWAGRRPLRTGALGVLFAGVVSVLSLARCALSRRTGRNPRRAAPRACGRHHLARHCRFAALLGHCRAALSGRTRVADLLLLDPALSGQGTRHGLTQIALFAWVPFLAADAGGVLGGYLAPLLQRWRPQP
jgi:ACS family hexuronate transporter-like MFS transporter